VNFNDLFDRFLPRVFTVMLALYVLIGAVSLWVIWTASGTIAIQKAEIRALRVDINTNAERIRALADEQHWIRSKTKIHREDLK